MTRTFALAFLAALALAAAPVAAAKPASVQEDNDKIVLANDLVVVWFQGKKPFLKLSSVANESESFTYKFASLVEYRDVDGDGLPSAGETLASLDLDRADAWNVTTTEANGSAVLNLSLQAPVKIAGGGPNGLLDNVTLPDRDARVTLAFTLRSEAVSLDAGNATLSVPVTSVKYDLVVESWPTVDPATSRLALEMKTSGSAEKTLGTGVDSATVTANGTKMGALAWTSVATGKTVQGADVPVPVKAALKEDGDDTRVVFTYDAAGLASLTHDPTIGLASASVAPLDGATGGVGEAIKDVPAPGLALVAVGVGAAVVAFRRR